MLLSNLLEADFTVAGVPALESKGFAPCFPQSGTYKIRIAGGDKPDSLLRRMYSMRGYTVPAVIKHTSNQSTVVVQWAENAVGTITVTTDTSGGLAVEALYPDVVSRFREQGARLCEFGKLAMDQSVRSKPVLGAMFHVSVILACRVRGATDILIEVNPRHVAFYRRALGFTQIGDERYCPRVDAPAVLLHVPLSYVVEKIQLFGGKSHLATDERSFYPYFFSPKEEQKVLERLNSLKGES